MHLPLPYNILQSLSIVYGVVLQQHYENNGKEIERRPVTTISMENPGNYSNSVLFDFVFLYFFTGSSMIQPT